MPRATGLHVSGLYSYPLKSTRGLSLKEAGLDALGLEGDRRWALVNRGGRAITQRDDPRLATVRALPARGGLEVEAPGREPLYVETPKEGEPVRVSLWKAEARGIAATDEAHRWFSGFLDTDCRLVHMPAESARPIDPRYGRPGDRVGFADGFPLLLVSMASVDDLNARLPEPIPANRFRPNVIVAGGEPFAEDTWTRIRVGRCTFRVVKPCARCAVTTIDQETGTKGLEPLRTLTRFRQTEGKVLFGQNLIHEATGRLRIGDPVEVLA